MSLAGNKIKKRIKVDVDIKEYARLLELNINSGLQARRESSFTQVTDCIALSWAASETKSTRTLMFHVWAFKGYNVSRLLNAPNSLNESLV